MQSVIFRLSRLARQRRATLAWALLFILPLASLLALALPHARAIEAPPTNAVSYIIETFGPNYPIAQGAWYSNAANGVGAGYHYADVVVPCGWPADKSIMIDLFSPEMTQNGASDEPRSNGRMPTRFELYQPGTPVGPGLAEPGPGAAGSLHQVEYQPSNAQANWKRFHVLSAPVACGVYLLRSEAGDDDGNVWRLRVGYDSDTNPNNTSPANYDNPDAQPGTGDELIVSVLQTGFKHPANPSDCLTLYEYIKPEQATAVFHNFDMESTGTVTYIGPSGQSYPGTASARIKWNNGALTDRGTGDVIASPEPGWWQIITCAGSDTHFIQEGQLGVPAHFQPPPTPRVVVSKDDGRELVARNELLSYTILFTNTAGLAPFPLPVPGAAYTLVLTDTLPAYTIFQSCAIDLPFTGSCAASGGQVVYTLNGKLNSGARGSVRLELRTAPDAPTGLVRNDVRLTYRDDLGNPFVATDNDIDTILGADLALTKTVDQPRPNVGDTITFEVVVRNDGPVAASGVVVSDPLPGGLSLVAATPAVGDYSVATGLWTVGALPVGGSARLTLAAQVAGPASVVNTAQVSAANQPDPDSVPGNSNPNEDDQASAAVQPQVADLSLLKRVSNTSARNGDTLVYTIELVNAGPDMATGVGVSDPLPAGVVYLDTGISQGSYDLDSGVWTVGTLAVGQHAILQLTIVVATDDKLTNTAQVSAAQQFDPDSTPGNNNPAEDDQSSVTTPVAPTAVELHAFTVQRQAGGVLVAWATGAELNTWAFELYRSADGQRAHAERVTLQPIMAQGRGPGGGSYSFADRAAGPAGATYWLVEIELSGATHEYGPVALGPAGPAAAQQVFIPLAAR